MIPYSKWVRFKKQPEPVLSKFILDRYHLTKELSIKKEEKEDIQEVTPGVYLSTDKNKEIEVLSVIDINSNKYVLYRPISIEQKNLFCTKPLSEFLSKRVLKDGRTFNRYIKVRDKESTPNLISTETIKEWLKDKPTPPLGGAVPMGYVWGLSLDLLESRGERYPYDILCFKNDTKKLIDDQINNKTSSKYKTTSNNEATLVYRGSISDLVTDISSLLSSEEQVKLGEELILKVRHQPDPDKI